MSPQTVFTLFYAITWGTAANSQPRWRAFAWAAPDEASRARAWLSMLLLNVFPWVYFVIILWCLSSGGWSPLPNWNIVGSLKIFLSIWPALAPFGFYRIWMACVAHQRERFYGVPKDWEEFDEEPEVWRTIGIAIHIHSDLNRDFVAGNFRWGFIYILVGIVVSFVVRCFACIS